MSNRESRRSRTECALLQPSSEHARKNEESDGNRLSAADRAIITRYFDGRWRRLAPAPVDGRRTRRRWIVGGKLPANVATAALPPELTEKLSPLDPGYERLLAGADVLCVEIATHKIADVMRDAGSHEAPDTPQLLLGYPADQPLTAGNGTL